MPTNFDKLTLADAERTVWVFGAGASRPKPYDVPAQTGILEHFATKPVPGPDGARMQLDELRTEVRGYCRELLPGSNLEDATVTLEELFSAFELQRDDPRSTRDEVAHADRAIAALLKALRIATQVYGRGDAAKWCPHERGNEPAAYAELIEKLLPKGSSGPSRHVLVTFNYDVNLDRCLINLRGGTPDGPPDYDLDYGITLANSRCPQAPSFAPPRPGQSVLLLRPHGALNWIRCRACSAVFTTVAKHQRIPDDLRCYACSKQRMDYVLVHPSFIRRYDDPNLQLVWGRAYEELTRADRWVFIGYSLPPADVHFRSLLRDARRARSDAKPLDVVLVDRGPESNEEFQRVVRTYGALFGDRLRVWRATADGFADFPRCIE